MNLDRVSTRTIIACLATVLLCNTAPLAAKTRTAGVQDCDRRVLVKTERNLTKLKSKDVENFLMTFASTCSHHDDFQALGNKLLFRVLQRKPKLFIQHLAVIPNGKRRAILVELESPVERGFDIPVIMRKVKKVKGHDRIKDDVLDSLKQAELKF